MSGTSPTKCFAIWFIRRRSNSYLYPGRRLVSIIQNTLHDHGGDSVFIGRILPGHALMGAFFTATSMIGFIAGAGIVVRNSIILVDFIELRLRADSGRRRSRCGCVRFRPMMLTAAAVIVGSIVILFDPIFQGLAISLMAGEVASLFLSRMTVPVLFFLSERKNANRRRSGLLL